MKFSASDTTITIGMLQYPTEVRAGVHDHGPGNHADESDKLFQPFQRTSVRISRGRKELRTWPGDDQADHPGAWGTHLGGIVDGKWLDFQFCAAMRDGGGFCRMKDNSSILIIDDDPTIRMATARLLRMQGYAISEAGDGLTGIRLALEQRPDLVLLAVDLPDLNGMEICQQLKAQPAMAGTFIVILSNSATDSDSQARGIELGADGYIARPIPNRELLARVQGLFRIRAAEANARRTAHQHSMIAEIGQLGLAGMAIKELMRAAVIYSARALQVERCHILQLHPDGATLVLAAGFGWPDRLIGQVILTDAAIVHKMSALESLLPGAQDRSSMAFERVNSEISLQEITDCLYVMIQGERNPCGLFGVNAGQGRQFGEGDIQYLRSVANLLSLAILRKHAEERVQYIAMHDGLTGLYNRSYFTEELHRLKTSRQFPVSVIVIDVDGLKHANDIYGHATGDLLLQSVSSVLRDAFRGGDLVARVGGDEFAALMPNADQAVAEARLQRIRDAINRQTFDLPGDLPVSLSMGVATAAQESALEESLLMADERMYRQKAEHHRQLNFYR